MKLSSIGTRGLVVYTGNKDAAGNDIYKFITENDWRIQGRPSTVGAPLVGLNVVAAPVAGQPTKTIFVNFDELALLAPPVKPTGPAVPASAPAAAWTIIVNEGAMQTEVPDAIFSALTPGSEGDAAVLVRRGAVVAAIPQNSIPSGSFCVLVNLPGIK